MAPGFFLPCYKDSVNLDRFLFFELQNSALSCQSKSDKNTYYLSCQTPS